MLKKFEKFNRQLGDWLEWIGVLGFLTMLVITCIDVFLTKILKLPIQGAIDIVMFAQLIAIAFSLAITVILGRHIQVEFIVSKLPRRIEAVVDTIVSILGLAFFIIIVWQLFILGHSFQIAGEKSMSQLRLPLFPFPYAISFASISVCLIFLHKFLNSLIRVIKG
jgi:TRAP-type C4-dicarboxylate transport system permease small subunit